MAEEQKILQPISTNCVNSPCVTSTKRRVAYVYNDEYVKVCSNLPKVENRSNVVHSLIAAYQLLHKLIIVTPRQATEDELRLFHSEDYLECLKRLSDEDDDEKHDEDAETYGLSYDCPAYGGVYEYAAYVAGASIKAAQALTMGIADVALNWCGGWHHAKRDSASGFCYINDVAVAIMRLRQKYDRVLYVDIDLHHGDGVEDAFCALTKVMTVSFHKAAPGFFPGTGYLSETGMGKGKYFAVNVPLKDGIQDDQYVDIFTRVMTEVRRVYKPSAVVCQCGADGLSDDPMASFNLTINGMSRCVQLLLGWNLPLLLVGGGGYNIPNTAKCWTTLTALTLGETLPSDIPEHKHFMEYGPDYCLEVFEKTKRNENDQHYLDQVYRTIEDNLKNIDASL